MSGLSAATQVVHGGRTPDPLTQALVPSLPLSIVFGHGNQAGYAYGRDHNRNWESLERALALLEGGAEALTFASGMAAIAAVFETCAVGAKVVIAEDAYTGTRELARHLSQQGRLEVVSVVATDLERVRAACAGARLLVIESLGNPLLSVPDIRACADIAREAGALTLVDNTFTTPLLVRPLTLGADLVVHSVSKFLGGHSDLMLGAVIVTDPELLAGLRYCRSNFGSVPGQLETWLALRGLRTLDVRLQRQVTSAQWLAEELNRLPKIQRVHYPGLPQHPQHQLARRQMPAGFGAMLSLELDCGAEEAESVCQATRIWTNATSLGSVESLLERRARWAGDDYLPPGLLRLSVGIEDKEDLLSDLVQALERLSPEEEPSAAVPPPAG